jgi:hypothetical protein
MLPILAVVFLVLKVGVKVGAFCSENKRNGFRRAVQQGKREGCGGTGRGIDSVTISSALLLLLIRTRQHPYLHRHSKEGRTLSFIVWHPETSMLKA